MEPALQDLLLDHNTQVSEVLQKATINNVPDVRNVSTLIDCQIYTSLQLIKPHKT